MEINNYNVSIDGSNFHDQPINKSVKKYGEIRKNTKEPGDDYTTELLLNYSCFKNSYQLIAIDLSK